MMAKAATHIPMATTKPTKKPKTAPRKTPRTGGTPGGGKKAPGKKATEPQEKRPTGRPTLHTLELARKVCECLMGGMSLRKTCEQPGFPHRDTVLNWIHDDTAGFFGQYARAREVQAEVYGEDTVEIADQQNRTVVVEWRDEKGKVRREPVLVAMDPADVAHRKLQVQARQWYAGKMARKRFGEHIEVETNEQLVTFRDFTGRKGQAPGADKG